MSLLNKPSAGNVDWTTLINDNWTLLEGLLAGTGQTVWYFSSNVSSSTYASGQPYTPLAKNATEQYISFDAVGPLTGKMRLTILYAMSVSNGGDVALELDYLKRSDGDDPNAAITTQSSFTFTPGTGTTRKSVGYGTQSTLDITVAPGDTVFFKLTRKNVAGDTHTGSMNILGVRVEVG